MEIKQSRGSPCSFCISRPKCLTLQQKTKTMKPEDIQIDAYDYPLPPERIARHPLAERDRCLLLTCGRTGAPATHIFNELPGLLPDRAVLVYNNTRVINARLRFTKSTGARIEIFCLEPESPADYAQNFAATGRCRWTCLVGNSKKWKDGPLEARLDIGGRSVTLTASRASDAGASQVIEFAWDGGCTFSEVIQGAGEIPIPPYLNRGTEQSDSTDYQTVYSHIEGSVAAPTAGLHFTPGVLDAIDARGIERLEVTLHVGAGTFQPVKSASIGDHPMHSEFIAVDRATVARLKAAIEAGRPVIAVGTTSVRTLESLYHIGCLLAAHEWSGEVPQWYPYADGHPRLEAAEALEHVLLYLESTDSGTLVASTRIIIAPGYEYKIVSGMVTNFHQPRSTLLLLVSAFLGGDRWRAVYDYALAGGYRFLSYGDACLFI